MSPEADRTSNCHSEAASPTAEELILTLRSSFYLHDFQTVAKSLTERENHLKQKYCELKKKTEEEKSVLVSKNLELEKALTKKQTEINTVRRQNAEYEMKLRVYEKRSSELDAKISSLEKMIKEPSTPVSSFIKSENKEQNVPAAECFRSPLFSEKVDSKNMTESKLQKVIVIDVEDDDVGGGVNHRKRVLNKIKGECDTSDADDDIQFISTVKRHHVFNEINSESAKTPSSCPETEMVDNIYNVIIAKTRKQKPVWQVLSDLVNDFDKDDELCMSGVCTLYRRRTILHGSDFARVHDLAHKLNDGDSQKKLKKEPSELNLFDLDQCRMIAKKYALQLFNIYLDQSDPFFPTS